jgi:HSF-type DNA-binding
MAAHISNVVCPDYHDHADKDEEWVEQQRQVNGVTAMEHTTGNTDRFPCRLHRMLEGVSASGHSSIVRWLPHGRAFKIYHKAWLVEHVLPVYFPFQTEYASFQRQLNIYGFVRLNCKGADKHGYYHELLLRGKSRMATLIPRKVGKGPAVRYVYDPDTAPNFYSMSWLPETVHAPAPALPIERHTAPSIAYNGSNDETNLADILDTSDDDAAPNDSHRHGRENTGTRRSKLADWVSFLEDMDFDAPSDT